MLLRVTRGERERAHSRVRHLWLLYVCCYFNLCPHSPLVSDLLRNVRRRVVLRIVRPYSAVRLSFLAEVRGRGGTRGWIGACVFTVPVAQELTISSEEVETLLVGLILDGSLEGKMDQIEGILRLKSSTSCVALLCRCGEACASLIARGCWWVVQEWQRHEHEVSCRDRGVDETASKPPSAHRQESRGVEYDAQQTQLTYTSDIPICSSMLERVATSSTGEHAHLSVRQSKLSPSLLHFTVGIKPGTLFVAAPFERLSHGQQPQHAHPTVPPGCRTASGLPRRRW